ncbi:MAG: preprotein translocase subunit SecE [Myxococcota bacterium]
MSKQRYMLLAFIVLAVAVGLTVQSAAVSLFAQFAIRDDRLLGLVTTSTVLAFVGGATCFFALTRSRAAGTFTREVVGELLRVTWPTREEAVRASTTVILTAILLSVLLAVYDFTWKNLADIILFTDR